MPSFCPLLSLVPQQRLDVANLLPLPTSQQFVLHGIVDAPGGLFAVAVPLLLLPVTMLSTPTAHACIRSDMTYDR